jgi:glyoxylate reductase
MPTVAVTRIIPEAALGPLRAAAEVRLWEDDLPPSPAELAALLRGCDGALTMVTDRIDAALLDAAPGLRVVSTFAVGYDNIDVAAATARGVAICNTPGVLTEATADAAFSLLLAAARRIPEGIAYVRGGEWRAWRPMVLLGHDIHAATLGIIGLGRIGRAVAASRCASSTMAASASRTPSANWAWSMRRSTTC